MDLLLTDVIMPGMSGPQLAVKILGKRPETKIVYMTGYTDDMVVQHKVLEPGVKLLQKPFGKIELALKVRSTLNETNAGGEVGRDGKISHGRDLGVDLPSQRTAQGEGIRNHDEGAGESRAPERNGPGGEPDNLGDAERAAPVDTAGLAVSSVDFGGRFLRAARGYPARRFRRTARACGRESFANDARSAAFHGAQGRGSSGNQCAARGRGAG